MWQLWKLRHWVFLENWRHLHVHILLLKADGQPWSARYLLPAAVSYNRGQPGKFRDRTENWQTEKQTDKHNETNKQTNKQRNRQTDGRTIPHWITSQPAGLAPSVNICLNWRSGSPGREVGGNAAPSSKNISSFSICCAAQDSCVLAMPVNINNRVLNISFSICPPILELEKCVKI